jgi:hypothetical protein
MNVASQLAHKLGELGRLHPEPGPLDDAHAPALADWQTEIEVVPNHEAWSPCSWRIG